MAERDSILIIEDAEETRELLVATLKAAGFSNLMSMGGNAATLWLENNRPALVLTDLRMPGADGFDILRIVEQRSDLHDVPVIVLTGAADADDIEALFDAGATDYVEKPFRKPELIARIRAHLQRRETALRLERRERDLKLVVELTQALASSLKIPSILHTVTRRLADVAEVDRCSIVLGQVGRSEGFVVASSDDEQLKDLKINLDDYPEVQRCMRTQEPLVIDNAAEHALLEAVRGESQAAAAVKSLALVPICHEGNALGVLFLRSQQPSHFDQHQLGLLKTVANAAAVALRNAHVLQSLKNKSQQSQSARIEAERRMRFFRRYADFFESAADGMVVTDHRGTILIANRRAREITGYSDEELNSIDVMRLLAPKQEALAKGLVDGFRRGRYPQGVDVTIENKAGQQLILSVNFSSVLRAERAVLLTFRDVTAERATERELRRTQDFMYRLIDSSIDAIVSSDLKGRVVVFNAAAARIFGYSPSDVIGKLNVAKLYPPGVAKDVMRKIRDPGFGGGNRLESYRVDMQTATGKRVPVRISAALIMEGERPMGSVGIFTDVRESIRMEARLVKAQEDLRDHERSAAVAQLAGATAHELNQPLTSILGYADLLLGHLNTDGPQRVAAQGIVTQTERMAEIVRKIGRLTRYDTKSYVGHAQILDLDSAGEPSSRRVVPLRHAADILQQAASASGTSDPSDTNQAEVGRADSASPQNDEKV